jgi:hypothetical protein
MSKTKSVIKSGSPALPDPRDPRRLLDRILDTPNLAQVVPRLQPELLHRLIRHCGLEDCGELVALATPDQLARVFDLDLWRTGQPGLDEQFDAERFGVWLEVLVESGVAVAAEKLANMDVDLVIVALAQHALVFDRAAISPPVPMDGEEEATVRALDDGLSSDVGGYRVVARRTDSWEAIVAALVALEAQHRDYFHRVMRGCRSLSNSGREVDGLDDLLTDGKQVMFDLAVDRERRREKQGYATPAQARAFLKMARQLRLGHGTTPPDNPVVRAYFRAIDRTTPADTDTDSNANSNANSGSRRLPAASGAPPSPEDSAAAVAAANIDVLLEAGVLTQQPRALLDGPQGQAFRLARIQAHMQFAHDRDLAAYAMRSQELAYLANTIVAGCSIQARAFTAQEASDAAVAVCNLGLENWPPHWLPAEAEARRGSSVVDAGTVLPDDFLVDHDLVSVFQVGWTVLHDRVSMYAAGQLIQVLAGLRCDDREIQAGLNALRIQLTRHWRAGTPWRAREALDVIASLDMPAWAALLGLIDECPVIHAAIAASRGSRVRAVSASAFEFISENSQIASVPAFMQSLPETLRG